jgi:hypothetical protein
MGRESAWSRETPRTIDGGSGTIAEGVRHGMGGAEIGTIAATVRKGARLDSGWRFGLQPRGGRESIAATNFPSGIS